MLIEYSHTVHTTDRSHNEMGIGVFDITCALTLPNIDVVHTSHSVVHLPSKTHLHIVSQPGLSDDGQSIPFIKGYQNTSSSSFDHHHHTCSKPPSAIQSPLTTIPPFVQHTSRRPQADTQLTINPQCPTSAASALRSASSLSQLQAPQPQQYSLPTHTPPLDTSKHLGR